MVSLLIPHGYKLLTKSTGEWTAVNSLPKEGSMCWNGHEFIPVSVERVTCVSLDMRIVVLDCVTAIAEDTGSCPLSAVTICYNPMPPVLSDTVRKRRCTKKNHMIQACRDFLRLKKLSKNDQGKSYLLPVGRRKNLTGQKSSTELHSIPYVRGKRYYGLRLPHMSSSQLCETNTTHGGYEHSLLYVNTVLQLKGVCQNRDNDKQIIIEIRDDGLNLRPDAFRRFRRCLYLCGIETNYFPKVLISRNGKKRVFKRTMRLSISSDQLAEARKLQIKKKSESKRFYTSTQIFHHSAKLTKWKRSNSDRTTWYRVKIKDRHNSLSIEGITVHCATV